MKKITELNQKAKQLIESGDLVAAGNNLKKSLQININQPNVIVNYASILKERKNYKEAIKYFKLLVKITDPSAEIYFNIALLYGEQGHYDEALKFYLQAYNLKPEQLEIIHNIANAYSRLEKYDQAIAYYKKSIALNPQSIDSLNNLAINLMKIQNFDEAIHYCKLAIKANPSVAASYNNIGNIYKEINEFKHAIRSYNEAVALDPNQAEFFYNLANTYQELLDFKNTALFLDKALDINNHYYPALWNKALTNLLLGNFSVGWELYECRWLDQQRHKQKKLTSSLWLGEEPLTNQSIIVTSEQGFGDAIQMYRYFPLLAQHAEKVFIETDDALMPLFSSLQNNLSFITKGGKLPVTDYHIPLMSLPFAFKTEVSTILNTVPYIFGNKSSYNPFFIKPSNRSLKIGLVWAGSKTHKEDHLRSIDCRLLEPIFKLPIEIHSLQKIINTDEQNILGSYKNIHQHSKNLRNFLDTACFIDQMDIVISVDTAVAHLAGAMSKEVWLMLPFIPDFRWLLERNDSPWYPTIRLYRQSEKRDWVEVIDSIVANLKKRL